MTARFACVAGWLGTGAAIVFGLYWLLLGTPESNALALIASAALVLLIVAVAGLFVNSALKMAGGAPFATSVSAAVRGLHWAVIAAGPATLLWWGIVRADTWVLDHSGEITAWFIARFGWGDVSLLFRAELWTSRWLRWSVIPLLSLALLGALLDGGLSGVVGRWRRRVLSLRALATAVLVFVVLMALPMPLIGWRPALPPTWMEPAVAAARLGAIALSWITGAALLVLLAAPPASSSNGARASD